MNRRYPRSAATLLLYRFTSAGAIMLEPGAFYRPSLTAQRRAGVINDIEAAQAMRRAGDKAGARARLEFCRAGRLALT